MEKSPKTVMVPLYITHADTVETRDLCAYLQKALRIDIDPDVGPNTPGVSELRFDARRLDPAEQYPNTIDPLLESQVLVDTVQPHFEAADYFWPTKPGRYTLWHASAPCAVFVLDEHGNWSDRYPVRGEGMPRAQLLLQGIGWIGARVGAKPAEIVLRTPAAGASVGKTELSPWPATYVAHPGTAPAVALVAGENVTLRASERLGEPFVTIETLSPPAPPATPTADSTYVTHTPVLPEHAHAAREAEEFLQKYRASYPRLRVVYSCDLNATRVTIVWGDDPGQQLGYAGEFYSTAENRYYATMRALARAVIAATRAIEAAAPPPFDVAAAKRLVADAKAAFAAATKGSKHDKWAFDWGPRLWAVATQLLDERLPQIESQGEKHDDTRTTKSGGSEPGHAGPAAAGG